MSAITDLRALLAADTAVAALVGPRISADRAEQGGDLPMIVFSGQCQPLLTLAGPTGDEEWSFEIQCWATTRAGAEAVAAAVAAACDGAHQYVQSRAAGFDQDTDLECAIVTVAWWSG